LHIEDSNVTCEHEASCNGSAIVVNLHDFSKTSHCVYTFYFNNANLKADKKESWTPTELLSCVIDKNKRAIFF